MMASRLFALLMLTFSLPANADERVWSALGQGGHVLLMRHALAPGTGDPSSFRLGDCATQRNLSETGRQQARRFGEELRRRGIPVDHTLSSEWCRTRDTAAEMAVAPVDSLPALNSFFQDNATKEAQTQAARRAVLEWRGPGNLVMVTHQVNITALTGVFPQSGEVVVLKPEGDGFTIVGRLSAGIG